MTRSFYFASLLIIPLSACSETPVPTPEVQERASSETRSIRVIAWNMHWFPGHYTRPSKPEAADHMAAAQAVLREAQPDILLFQEVYDMEAMEEVTSVVPGTKTAVISNFPPRNEKRPWTVQNVGVATRLPIVAAWFEMFEPGKNADPPRGFSVAVIKLPDGRNLVAYSLHLKSNRGSDDPKVFQENIYKREEGITQVLQHVREMKKLHATAAGPPAILIAGDFNTSLDDPRFAKEQTLRILKKAKYHWTFEGVPQDTRFTLGDDGESGPRVGATTTRAVDRVEPCVKM
jgi:endonuclease/exonuclease/phosphatase family metal-dependent hydrolase